MKKAFHAVIHGKVQGVGFRYFTQRLAGELHLGGWVRNQPDNTVEIWAVGTQETLEQFMQRLEVGPIGSRVHHIEAQWSEDPGNSKGFEITG